MFKKIWSRIIDIKGKEMQTPSGKIFKIIEVSNEHVRIDKLSYPLEKWRFFVACEYLKSKESVTNDSLDWMLKNIAEIWDLPNSDLNTSDYIISILHELGAVKIKKQDDEKIAIAFTEK